MLIKTLAIAFDAVRSLIFANADCVDWGSKIVWHTTIKEAEEAAMKTKKPIMVYVYNDTCPSCNVILPKITSSDQVAYLSHSFVVLALHDSDSPPSMQIDGRYVPRIYFMSPDGKVWANYYNRESDSAHKYFYKDDKVMKVMKEVLQDHGVGGFCDFKGPCDIDGNPIEEQQKDLN